MLPINPLVGHPIGPLVVHTCRESGLQLVKPWSFPVLTLKGPSVMHITYGDPDTEDQRQ